MTVVILTQGVHRNRSVDAVITRQIGSEVDLFITVSA